jgi:hypothetical protein
MGIGPFTSEVSQTLKIRNANHTPVAFKVSSLRLCGDLYGKILTKWVCYRLKQLPQNSMRHLV